MVSCSQVWIARAGWAAAQQPLWLRLEPPERLRILAALAALVMLGFALVGFAWWAGRWTRRYMQGSPPPTITDPRRRPHADDWASKPLMPKDDDARPGKQ